MENFLSIPEEFYLLAVSETKGNIQHTNYRPFKVALSGSILMDLALEHRIDTDLEKIIIDRKEPTGNEVLDIAFNEILLAHAGQEVRYWIDRLTERSDTYKSLILNSLIRKGVLKIENKKVLWAFTSRKYPVIDNSEIKEVKMRVRDLIMSEEIPDVRDIVIVSMLFYSGMLHLALDNEEMDERMDRIEQIARMDLIGQSISSAIEDYMVSYLWAGGFFY